MKKVVTATTTAKGAAVNSSKITAVQSVYMKRVQTVLKCHILGIGVLLLMGALPAQAGIDFTGCTSGPDGSITCNTVPTGNTLTDDIDARYDLDSEASPGWSEFEPDQGFDQDFGGMGD
jgi:hypothetical protein|tara:strand:+ start:79 stop:435 length:357 start_codon:yes stop_codon:yes gene_type:complete